jgi:hypothetical protein
MPSWRKAQKDRDHDFTAAYAEGIIARLFAVRERE